MNREQYKQKLADFNSTEKYQLEKEFLMGLLKPGQNERILDYGTGLGRMVYYINECTGARCFGYDLHNYRECDDVYYFRHDFSFRFHKVFFMHSIAHIDTIESRLTYLRDNLLEPDGQVIVITPNKEWMRMLDKVKGYAADPTVIEHYTSEELVNLFISCGFKVTRSGQFGAIQRGQHERLFLQASI